MVHLGLKNNMKKIIFISLMFFSVGLQAQVDTALIARTPVAGQPTKIITDAFLRARSVLAIPYVNSTTPSMNGAVNRAGYGLQLLSNGRLAIGAGGSSFFQFMNVTDLGTTYQTVANLSTDLTASATKYPSVNAVNTGLGLKANLASPTFTGAPAAPTATFGTNTTQVASTAFVQSAIAPISMTNTLSATTLTLSTRGYYTFTGGSPTTWTLPTLASSSANRYVIMNTGTATLTINTSASGNDIYSGGTAVNTVTVGAGESTVLYNNSTYFFQLN